VPGCDGGHRLARVDYGRLGPMRVLSRTSLFSGAAPSGNSKLRWDGWDRIVLQGRPLTRTSVSCPCSPKTWRSTKMPAFGIKLVVLTVERIS